MIALNGAFFGLGKLSLIAFGMKGGEEKRETKTKGEVYYKREELNEEK